MRSMRESYEARPFFMTFSNEISPLYETSLFNATTKVLWKLLEMAERGTGKVLINHSRRKEIINTCHISEASYQRALINLIDAGIICKKDDIYIIKGDMFKKVK